MTIYEFGDVLLVPFPYTNQTTTKKRPAVVISSKSYNQIRPDIILLAITSKVKQEPIFGDVSIVQWKESGLPLASVIKPVISTFEKNLVIKKLGRLHTDDLRSLQVMLGKIIDFE